MSTICRTAQRTARLLTIAVALLSPALAQRNPAPGADRLYSRAWAVVPLTGAGTLADPIRPKHAPAALGGRSGILAYSFVLSDDGKHAIVIFVGSNLSALNDLLTDASPDVQSFLKGRDDAAAIESALGKYKRNFRLNDLRVVIP